MTLKNFKFSYESLHTPKIIGISESKLIFEFEITEFW